MAEQRSHRVSRRWPSAREERKSDGGADFTLLEPQRLLPAQWRHFAADGPVRVFNPGLLRRDDDWLFAYRVVGPDLRRRIGLCRLRRDLQPIDGSPLPLSDSIRFARGHDYLERTTTWFADPRLFRL